MVKNQFLIWEKVLPKMHFHEKKIFCDLLISRVFLPGHFLNFLARCEIFGIYVIKTICAAIFEGAMLQPLSVKLLKAKTTDFPHVNS